MKPGDRSRRVGFHFAAALVAVIGGSLAFPRDARAQGNLVVTITSPTSGSTVSGTITVSASVSPLGVLVGGVQFKLDGASLGAEDKAAPYAVSWNTTGVGNGSHSLTAVARDALGLQYSSSPVTVTVSNAPPPDTTPPAVGITSPGNGTTVSGTISVTASASDNVGVAGVQFRLDGANLGAEDTSLPYGVSWNTTTVANGSHSLTAAARDAAGNSTTSATVTVTVSNAPPPDTTPPAVSITAPANGATVSGTISVSASASDNVGVAGVQFKIDGANLAGEDTTSPYAISWDTTTAANGSHSLTATARDAAGNSTTSTTVIVSVSNTSTGGTTRIEETDPSVAYTGNWIPQSRADLSGGSIVEGPDAGSTASLTFNGTGVRWIGFRADFGGIAEVYLDGVLKATVDTYSPTQQAQAVMYTASGLAAGTHTIMIRVTGTWSASACCSWIVVDAFDVTSGGGGSPPPDTTPPTVNITSPANGATVSGTTTVSASASDNIGVAGVLFLLDSVALGPEDTTAPYSVSWNTTTVSNGSHTLSATARDAAGNRTTSAPVTVTVSNSAPPSSTRFEESSATLSPAASWIALTSASTGVTLSGDSATAAADAGATASFTFTGQGVSWIGFKCEQCGIASVLLDGSVVATVDTYVATRPAASGSMFSVTGLAAGNHTLVIQVTGNKNASSASTYVVVDAFDVM
ncbi:MAG TPA: Ig-like domain-containing protein [Candidatus Dormibacteraeota bacterium]|nr:Ig-like domain-containing protein [Candidatus Dormibacteraeota bacterium]